MLLIFIASWAVAPLPAAPNRVKTDLLSSDWRISVQGSAASCRQGWQAENDGHCEIKLLGSCEDGRLDKLSNCEL